MPRPVYGHGLVFITTGFNEPSLLAIRVGGTGDVTRHARGLESQSRACRLRRRRILVGDELYMVSDIGIASCLDARTGKVHWVTRIDGN